MLYKPHHLCIEEVKANQLQLSLFQLIILFFLSVLQCVTHLFVSTAFSPIMVLLTCGFKSETFPVWSESALLLQKRCHNLTVHAA